MHYKSFESFDCIISDLKGLGCVITGVGKAVSCALIIFLICQVALFLAQY